MKKIILLFCFAMISLSSFSQFQNDSLHGFDEKHELDHIFDHGIDTSQIEFYLSLSKRRYINRKYNLGFYAPPENLNSSSSYSPIQNISSSSTFNCATDNWGFEDGTLGGWNQQGAVDIVSNGVDPYGGYPWVYPNGGNFSAKISSDLNCCRDGRLDKVLNVPANSESLMSFHFAMSIFNYPHMAYQAAKFWVEFYDASGNILPCPQYECFYSTDYGAVGVDNFQQTSQVASYYNPAANGDCPSCYPVTYADWNTVTLDLSNYQGQQITAVFRVEWCIYTPDWAYVLLDVDCPITTFQPTDICLDGTGQENLCGPENMASYTWYDPSGTIVGNNECLAVSAPGNYILETAPLVECTSASLLTFNYLVNPSPDESYSVSNYNGFNVSCEGESDGWINMNSVPGCTYVWQTNPPQTGPNISILSAGTYTVDMDLNGCDAIMDITLDEPILQMNGVVSPICFGLIDGDIVLSPSGGLIPYTYLWDTGDTASSLSDLDTGVYSVQIFDAYGCVDSATYVITESTQLSTQYTTSDYNGYQISCYGLNDGYIDLTISGSVPNYYAQWSSGQTSYDIYNLYAGVYTVNIIDDNGCKDSLEINIYEPPSILSNIVPTAIYNGYEISCNGYNDGFIDLSVSGAYPPYTFSWNTGETTEDLDSLVAGIYTVTIIDTNNCPHVDNIVLDEPTVLFDNIISVYDYNTYDISCYNYNDGAIDLSVYGSVFPYYYQWNTLDVSQDLDSITEGWYFVDILDANNCFISDSIYLSHPTPIISSYTIPVMNGYNVTCNGGQDGSVDLTVNGSVPPYNFQWSNGYNSEDLASLGAGDYIYVATDQNGCVTTDTLAIIEPILIIEDSVNHVSCSDGIDGAVFVNVSGSTAPYYVIWDNNINTSMLEDGVYSYQIIDSIGCTYNYNIIVNEPQPFVVVEQVVDVSCFGENDGSVSLNITGATPPYVIDWFGYATFNMIAGTYNFTITDSNNCQYSEIAIINEPNPLDITYSISLPSCVDSYDGEIHLTVVGGTPTYNQNWLGFNPNSLGVGVFDVIVTDTNGCTENSSISLSPRSDMLIIEDVVNASCEGFCDGSADFAISNGILPYQSNWGGFNPDSLCPGVYFYEITDSLNCLYSDSILITSPDSILLYITENSGVLYANASGGVPPYSFSWFNIGNQLGNGETHTVTYIGDYYCVAYDNQHCQSDTAFYSNIILGINQSSVNGLLVYPNPANGNLNIEFSTESNTEIEVGIIDVLGQYILLDTKNSSKGLYKEKIDLSLYARGVYLLNIRLNHNENINKKLILK